MKAKRIWLAAAALSAALAQAQTLSATLDNGMKVVVKEDARAPVAVS